jgi:hypothetical protein
MKNITITILLFLLAFVNTKAQEKKFSSATHHFSINYPSTWNQIKKADYPVIEFGASSPLENDSDAFSENVNLVIDSTIIGDMPLTNYGAAAVKELKLYTKKFKLVEQGDDSASNGYEAKTIIYKHTASEIYKLKALTYIYKHNNRFYVFTCTAIDDSFEKYKPAFIKICRSIVFLSNQ